jgi:hypothetical protein
MTIDRPWRQVQPREAATWLSPLTITWWFAGGWALDLFVGTVTRRHQDLDVGIFRRDALAVFASLPAWEFFEARDGVLTPILDRHAPRPEVNSLWCRRKGILEWELELMLDDSDADHWVFRRHHQIRRPLKLAILRNSEGTSYLAPEIQLLYKARSTRAQDQADFDYVVPRLDSDARSWLRDSLAIADPGHSWLSALKVGA